MAAVAEAAPLLNEPLERWLGDAVDWLSLGLVALVFAPERGEGRHDFPAGWRRQRVLTLFHHCRLGGRAQGPPTVPAAPVPPLGGDDGVPLLAVDAVLEGQQMCLALLAQRHVTLPDGPRLGDPTDWVLWDAFVTKAANAAEADAGQAAYDLSAMLARQLLVVERPLAPELLQPGASFLGPFSSWCLPAGCV